MALHYSPSRNAFFDDALSGMPDDARPIDADRHRQLLEGQATGARIAADAKGDPCLIRPRQSVADRRAQLVRQVKREAARRIDVIAPPWRQMNDLRAADAAATARFAAIDAVRAASDRIEAAVAVADKATLRIFDIASNPLWPAD